MSAWVDKLLHFATGLGVGITFWWLLERHLRIAARRINPIIFLIMLMWGALLIVVAIYLGALKSLPEVSSGWDKLWKGLGVVILIYGALFLIGVAGGSKDTLKPLSGIIGVSHQSSTQAHAAFTRVKTIDDLNRELAAAKSAGKPVMLDFYADWCAYCKTMEKKVFPDPQVVAALENVVMLQADITVQDDADKALASHLKMTAPPALYFWDKDGTALNASTLTGSVTADELAAHLTALFK